MSETTTTTATERLAALAAERERKKELDEDELEDDEPKQIVHGTEAQTPWGSYLNSLNSKYQKRIQQAAQKTKYEFTMRYEDGHEQKSVFHRMKLLQYQYDEIEDLRNEANELGALKPRDSAKALAKMYLKAAGYIMWNVKEDRPMTTEEYNHCIFSEIRPALDASMLLGLISDPN